MKSLDRHRQFRFGMRTTKTAISVMIALTTAYAVGSAYPGFMAIGALGSMERSIVDSIRSARNQSIGNLFGARYKSKAELAGGIILVAMGVKILLEHLGVFGG